MGSWLRHTGTVECVGVHLTVPLARRALPHVAPIRSIVELAAAGLDS